MQLKIHVNLYAEKRFAKDFLKLRMVSVLSVSSLAVRKMDESFRSKALIRVWDLLEDKRIITLYVQSKSKWMHSLVN